MYSIPSVRHHANIMVSGFIRFADVVVTFHLPSLIPREPSACYRIETVTLCIQSSSPLFKLLTCYCKWSACHIKPRVPTSDMPHHTSLHTRG